MLRRLVPIVLMSLALAACSKLQTTRLTHDTTVLNRGNGADITSLDPHYITGNWEAYVAGDCLIGLTTEDINGGPMPGAAESWSSSPDGKTWTFRLRDHVWSDGVPVTAQDFVFAWRRILEPARGAQYAYFLWLVKNAHDVNTGKLPPEALGIVAKDDKTLVVSLEHPAPFLPEWLMHQTTYPVPRHVVMAKGNDWARVENYVGNGPYLPVRWVPNDHLTLRKNPRFYDATHVRIETVNYYPTVDSTAGLKALVAGQLDTLEPLPISEIDWLRKNMADALVLKPNLSTSFIIFNFKHHPFDDHRVRDAMSLTYNREAVTYKILKLGDPPAYAFVPPGTANYPGGAHLYFKDMPRPERIKRALALMQAAGYGPDNRLHTTYLTTSNPDNKRTATALQGIMKQIYIDIDIIQVDPQNFYRQLALYQFDLTGSAWIGDFNDAVTFLDLLRTGAQQNYGQYSSAKFDALYAEAQQQADLVKRGELMKEAEQTALDDDAIIPTRFRLSQTLVQPYVRGWNTGQSNLRNFHRTRWLWIDPKAVRQ
jgi:oligopeptide transport system substrate-binding protein